VWANATRVNNTIPTTARPTMIYFFIVVIILLQTIPISSRSRPPIRTQSFDCEKGHERDEIETQPILRSEHCPRFGYALSGGQSIAGLGRVVGFSVSLVKGNSMNGACAHHYPTQPTKLAVL
jgi:hypothetical protein